MNEEINAETVIHAIEKNEKATQDDVKLLHALEAIEKKVKRKGGIASTIRMLYIK